MEELVAGTPLVEVPFDLRASDDLVATFDVFFPVNSFQQRVHDR